MEMIYRIEYSEQQGCFHQEWLKGRVHEANTNGWVTIIEKCNDEHSMLFDWYLEAIYFQNISRADRKLTLKEVKSAYKDFSAFLNELEKRNRQIVKNKPKINSQ
jgi:hypothetical protein